MVRMGYCELSVAGVYFSYSQSMDAREGTMTTGEAMTDLLEEDLAVEPEEVSGYINMKDYLLTLREAIRLNEGHTINRLLSYVDQIKEHSFAYLPRSIQRNYEEEHQTLKARIAGMSLMEALRNSEDFSPEHIEERLGKLKEVCRGDTGQMAEAMAGAR
jgi:hypothetical protein